MTDTTSAIFLPTAHLGTAWDLARKQLSRPRNNEAPLLGIREGMAVRDLHARYSYTIDLGDIDGLMQFFTDDCVISSPSGTFSGTAQIRSFYEKMIRDTPHRFHMWSNVVVRLSDDFHEGDLTANFYALLQGGHAQPRAVGGLIADQVTKRDGVWKICARSTAVDVTVGLTPIGDTH